MNMTPTRAKLKRLSSRDYWYTTSYLAFGVAGIMNFAYYLIQLNGWFGVSVALDTIKHSYAGDIAQGMFLWAIIVGIFVEIRRGSLNRRRRKAAKVLRNPIRAAQFIPLAQAELPAYDVFKVRLQRRGALTLIALLVGANTFPVMGLAFLLGTYLFHNAPLTELTNLLIATPGYLLGLALVTTLVVTTHGSHELTIAGRLFKGQYPYSEARYVKLDNHIFFARYRSGFYELADGKNIVFWPFVRRGSWLAFFARPTLPPDEYEAKMQQVLDAISAEGHIPLTPIE